MVSQCKVCHHSQHAAIDVALYGATSLRDLAATYGLSKDSLARHKARHLPTTPPPRRRATPRQTTPTHAHEDLPARKANGTIPAELRPGAQAAFLAAFVTLGNETGACRSISINPTTIDWWEEHDPDFSLRYARAKLERNDVIRGEMYRRAIVGTPEPVVSAGKVMTNPDGSIMTVQKYSDGLISKLAAAWMPEFRESKQQIEISGANGGPIQMQQVRGLTDEELAAMKVMFQAAVIRNGATDPPNRR